MLMKPFLIFVFLCGYSFATRAGVFVGNGGEGVLTNDGRVELRDLYEAEIFGLAITNWSVLKQIEARLRESELLKADPELFGAVARKLSEIESRETKAGEFLAELIVQHSWLKTRLDLKPSTDDDSPLNIPSDRRVLLANRYQLTVRVNESRWTNLSTAQKAALVIHEMISACFRLACAGGECSQPAPLVREIVARVFAPKGHALYRPNLTLLKYLNVPEPNSRITCEDGGPGIGLTRRFTPDTYFSSAQISEVARLVCAENSAEVTELALSRSQWHAMSEVYFSRSGDGKTYPQNASSIKQAAPRRIVGSRQLSDIRQFGKSCELKIEQLLHNWFTYDQVESAGMLMCTERQF